MNPVINSLLTIIDCLDAKNVPYAVMGGLAVRVHAVPRPTNDVDLTISIQRTKLEEWYEQLEQAGITVPIVYRNGWVDEVANMPLVKLKIYLDQTQGICSMLPTCSLSKANWTNGTCDSGQHRLASKPDSKTHYSPLNEERRTSTKNEARRTFFPPSTKNGCFCAFPLRFPLIRSYVFKTSLRFPANQGDSANCQQPTAN